MSEKKGLKKFLWEQRTSARLAYIIHLATRIFSSAMALFWIRLLVGAMGQELNSLYLAFQKVVSLGGLGDLGMGGAVGIRAGQYLGQGKQAELRTFLASARAVFLMLALVAGGGMMALSPWLPHWLRFREVPAMGAAPFSADDFTDLKSLSEALKKPAELNGASAYVTAHLSDNTRALLSHYEGGTNAPLQAALAADFNRMTLNADLFEPQRFTNARLSAKTSELLKEKPQGENLVRLNRLLLLDAYPRQIARNHPSGSLRPLFAIGGLLIMGVMLSSYLSNLNYACGNVTWPIVPLFILLQLTMLGQWLLARQDQPLWIQYLPAVIAAAAGLCLTWFYIRTSHPALAQLRGLKFDWRTATSLFESSFWLYLCSLGNVIYRSTDGLVINAGFKQGTLAGYEYNYKFCELVVFLVLAASYVSLPKITQWMASTDPKDQERVRVEMRRLNQFQTLLGCGAALAYLAGNNLFMKVWWLHKANPILPAALSLQIAFALNLVVTTCGDAGIQLALRTGQRGLRMAGMAIGLTGFLNLGLSIVAMKLGSLQGIAMATVAAQSVLSLVASSFTCRYLKIPWLPWALRGWLFPLAGISLAAWFRWHFPPDSAGNIFLLGGIYAVMLVTAAWALGVKLSDLQREFQIFSKFFRK